MGTSTTYVWRSTSIIGLLAVTTFCWTGPVNLDAGNEPPAKKDSSGPAALETKKLQGIWNQIDMILDGQTTNEKIAKQFTFRFDGSSYTNARNGKVISEGKFTLDSKKSPAHMDLIERDGTKLFTICRLEGDTLTICLHESVRPTTFESNRGQQRLLVTLKRKSRGS